MNLFRYVGKIWRGITVALQRDSTERSVQSEAVDVRFDQAGKTPEAVSVAPPEDDQGQAPPPSGGGPPDHWVQRVKEHAPELLLPRPPYTLFSNPSLGARTEAEEEALTNDPGTRTTGGIPAEGAGKEEAPGGEHLPFHHTRDAADLDARPLSKATGVAKHATSFKERSEDVERQSVPTRTSQANDAPRAMRSIPEAVFPTSDSPRLPIIPHRSGDQNVQVGRPYSHSGDTEKENRSQPTADVNRHPFDEPRPQPSDAGLFGPQGGPFLSTAEEMVSPPDKSIPRRKYRKAGTGEKHVAPYTVADDEIPPPSGITPSKQNHVLANREISASAQPTARLQAGGPANYKEKPVQHKRVQTGELPSNQGMPDGTSPAEQIMTDRPRHCWPDLFQTGLGDRDDMDANKDCWPSLPERSAAENGKRSNSENEPLAHRQQDLARLARMNAEQQGILWNGLHF